MPLLDHFHPPLSERRHWHSFHNSWATYLSSQLNGVLPGVGAGDPGPGPSLYGSAYRPLERNGATMVDVWLEPLAVGQRLPTLPLWPRGGLCLPVELEATYERTCVEQRIQPAA